MRLTVLISLTCIVGLYANDSYSQDTRLTIDFSGQTVEKALDQIEHNSEFLFLFSNKLVDVERRVNLQIEDKPIHEILDNLFAGTNTGYKVFSRQIILAPEELLEIIDEGISGNMKLQGIVITGKITDEDSISLPGANIMIEGTTIGAITNMDGEFQIEVPSQDVSLVFSYVGYLTQTISLEDKTTIDVVLALDIQSLEEVVFIGYGTKRRVTVTGSVADVKGEELEKTPANNLANTLTGKMAGVVVNTRGSAPGAESINISIRGKGSWNEGSPLIIIDGIANRAGFERIDPNDVESISVLKDASAAIYGSRAANGVILVTTKRGRMGKPTIEYTGNFGLAQPSRVLDMCRSWQYATYYTEAQRAGYMWTNEEIQRFKEGSNQNLYPNYDLNDYILQKFAPETNHTLSLRGGNESVKYFVSGRYLYQDSYFKDGIDNFNSNNIRSNIDAQVNKNFSLALNLLARKDRTRRAVGSGYTQAGGIIDVGWFESYFTDPTKPMYYENGMPAAIYSNNDVERIKGNAGESNMYRSTINTQITARWDLPFITQGLYLEGTGAYDFINDATKQFSKSYDLYAFDNATGTYTNMNTNPTLNRSLYDYYYNSNQYTLNARIGYDKTINDHSISAFVAYEQYSTNSEWITATRNTFLSTQIPYLFAGDPNTQKNDGSGSEYAYRNVFGRIAYNFQQKYLLDFTLRRDESLKFPEDNRVGWFPGISVGWRLSEESFMDQIDILDNLKLRASWGQMGSDNVAAYQYLATAALQSSWGSMVFGSSPSAITSTMYFSGTPNPYISWEVANTSNLALEGALWRGLLGFELEYFLSKRSNILSRRNASVPIYTGMSLPDENIGEAQNQGFEMVLSHRNRLSNFSYGISGNFTYMSNKIIFMDESPNVPDYQRRENHPIDSWLLYKTDGIFNTQGELDGTPAKRPGSQVGDIKYVDSNNDGVIDDLDKIRVYDSPLPKMIYGVDMNFKYMGIELHMLWQGQAGAKTYINPTERNGDINIPLWLYDDRWTPANPNASLPRAFYHRSETYNTLNSDFWLKDASFLRLRSLELAYSLPQGLFSRISVQGVRVYFRGLNLLLIDKIKNYDPEVVNDLGTFYPATRTYQFGLRVTL